MLVIFLGWHPACPGENASPSPPGSSSFAGRREEVRLTSSPRQRSSNAWGNVANSKWTGRQVPADLPACVIASGRKVLPGDIQYEAGPFLRRP